MLTNAAVKAARPTAHAFKRWDAGGLYLLVVPTGRRSWMMRIRTGGRETLLTLGQWPDLSLDAARTRRDAARAAIEAGHDPRAVLQIRTFEAAARAWHAHRAPGWTPVHAADVLRSLERDVFAAIGPTALDQVTPPAVLQLLRAVERRGAIETARRLRQRIGMICAFARGEGWMSAENPAGDVKENLANAPAKGRQPALEDLGEIRALVSDVGQLVAAPLAKLASTFLSLTAVRLAALLGMRWGEVDELDGVTPVWRVPAARMKLRAVNKLDAQRDHLVPLSTAAADALRAARAIAGAPGPDDLVFVGRSGDAPIGEDALNQLYGRAGYAGRHCAHGWRASFSTVMNERRPADRAAIDRALGHVVSGVSENEGAYNRAQHLDRRRAILEDWAFLITS